jgi:predicted phosphate transport protein (TIGR00153 family)
MRSPFFNLFRESPFVKLLNHAKTVEGGGAMFRRAMICYLDGRCDEFDHLHMEVTRAESEADWIKRNIRGHLPKGLMMPVDKFQYLWYLREQDKIMDSMQDTLHWLSYRTTVVPDPLVDDLLLMVDKAVEVVNEMPVMVNRAMDYFRSFSEEDRKEVKESIKALRNKESQSDQIERKLKSDIFAVTMDDPTTTFHLIRLVENMGEISNHAENAGDVMRAMIAR